MDSRRFMQARAELLKHEFDVSLLIIQVLISIQFPLHFIFLSMGCSIYNSGQD